MNSKTLPNFERNTLIRKLKHKPYIELEDGSLIILYGNFDKNDVSCLLHIKNKDLLMDTRFPTPSILIRETYNEFGLELLYREMFGDSMGVSFKHMVQKLFQLTNEDYFKRLAEIQLKHGNDYFPYNYILTDDKNNILLINMFGVSKYKDFYYQMFL